MDISEVDKIFNELQQKTEQIYPISPERKLKPLSKFNFWADPFFVLTYPIPKKIHPPYYDYSNNPNIFFDTKIVEFLDETQLKIILLHEEGHKRYFLNKLTWDDKQIEPLRLPYKHDGMIMEREINSDKYAVKIFSKLYSNFDSIKIIEIWQDALDVILTYMKKKWIYRINRSNNFQESYDERLKNIQKFCEEDLHR